MAEARARILAVDDNEAKRYAVTRVLKKAGFDVEEAQTGSEALVRATAKPDLIVLDVKLPDINGFEVCRRIKEDPETSSIPVLQLSASFTRAADRVTGLDSGADAYLTDPVEPAELVATVNALLRGRRAEEVARESARQWQATFDAIRDGLCLTSTTGKILECNRALATILGSTPESLRGRIYAVRVAEALHVTRPLILAAERASREREVAELAAGDRWFRLSRDAIVDDAGEIVGAVHILSDITESKRGEQAVRFLAEASARLGSTLVQDELVRTLVAMAIPAIADFAAVDLVRDGRIERVALGCADPSLEPMMREASAIDLDRTEWANAVLREGKTFRRSRPLEPPLDTLLSRLDLVDGIVLPLVAQGTTLGALHLGSHRAYDPTDLWTAEGLARSASAALGNAGVHAAVLDAERSAEESRALVDVIMERAPVGIAVFDSNARFVRANAALSVINGLPAQAHVGHRVHEILPHMDPQVQVDLDTVIATGAPLTREAVGMTLATAAPRRWLTTYYPLIRAQGEVFGVGALVVDVTEQRQMEDRLRFLSEASRILASSLRWEETLGSLARLCVPQLADWCVIDMLDEGRIERLVVTHADPAKADLAQQLQRSFPPNPSRRIGVPEVLRTGRPERFDHVTDATLARTDFDPEYVRTLREIGISASMVVPLSAPSGVIGALTLVSAESGRRYTDDDLAFAEELARRAGLAVENARLYEESQQAIRQREDVLAFVSHDLKNPLTSIVMNATLLKRAVPEGAAGEKLVRHGDMIVRAAERMNRLVHDLLDWASLRAKRLTLNLQDVDLGALVNDVVTLLQPVAAMKKLEVSSSVPLGLVVPADRERVTRVLSNIVGNALKFTPDEGTVEVRADANEAEVVLRVIDTGPGIPQDELPHVFDRYFRAKQTGTEGTGLGLAIAKGIVEAHGGRIWAESKVGTGSTFAFALPRVRHSNA